MKNYYFWFKRGRNWGTEGGTFKCPKGNWMSLPPYPCHLPVLLGHSLSLSRSQWSFCCSRCIKLGVNHLNSSVYPLLLAILLSSMGIVDLWQEWALRQTGPSAAICEVLSITFRDLTIALLYTPNCKENCPGLNYACKTCIYACDYLQSKLKVAQIAFFHYWV